MIPLFSTEQVRDADLYAINELNIQGSVLMENASISIFNEIQKNYSLKKGVTKIGIIAGKGNNGGDSFALARHLANNEYLVSVLFVGKEKDLKGDAQSNFKIIKKLSDKINNLNIKEYQSKRDFTFLKTSDIIVDGLLGTGTKGEIKEPYKSLINYVNSVNAFKVAIDLPSGLNLSTSTGSVIFNADLTVTLAELKTGLFYAKGFKSAGKVVKGSIGIGAEYFNNLDISQYLIEPEDALLSLPPKEKTSHKYQNGKVLVIAGSGKYPGAASLVTRSLFSIGTGAVQLAFPKSIRTLVSQNIGEAVFASYEDNEKEYLSEENITELKNQIVWSDVIAIGSGLGRDSNTVNAVAEILKHYQNKRFVIDADAIYAISQIGLSKIDLKGKILTPHYGEFANLIGISIKELENNIIDIATEFCKRTRTYLVLKGAPSIIFNPQGELFINSVGNPGMAKFGSGDVLTGVIAGLLSNSEIENALIAGLYLHSLSADLLLKKETEYGITATKIEENLPNAIRFLRNSII